MGGCHEHQPKRIARRYCNGFVLELAGINGRARDRFEPESGHAYRSYG
jgi:hypothetical protein